MNYTEIVNELAVLTGISATNADFLTDLTSAFLYAEGRITRELDLMAANITDGSSSTVASSRNFNLPTALGTFLIVDTINIITPASVAPDSGTRNVLQAVSKPFLDMAWPSSTGATVPQYYAYLTQDTYTSPAQTQIIFGPWPDDTYRVEVTGKIQPPGLSSTNMTTWLSVNLPDLYVAACMVQLSGYMKNYSAAGSDDPGQPVNWEKQYLLLRDSAATYEARKRFSGASWTSKQLEPMAQPQRG